MRKLRWFDFAIFTLLLFVAAELLVSQARADNPLAQCTGDTVQTAVGLFGDDGSQLVVIQEPQSVVAGFMTDTGAPQDIIDATAFVLVGMTAEQARAGVAALLAFDGDGCFVAGAKVPVAAVLAAFPDLDLTPGVPT